MSRESSREDLNSDIEQQFDYEQRFRVDRKKLEIMMTNSPEFGEAAAEFFERIGIETDTCVIWPSRYFNISLLDPKLICFCLD